MHPPLEAVYRISPEGLKVIARQLELVLLAPKGVVDLNFEFSPTCTSIEERIVSSSSSGILALFEEMRE